MNLIEIIKRNRETEKKENISKILTVFAATGAISCIVILIAS